MLEGIVLALVLNLTDADGATTAPEFSDGTEISADLLPQIRVKASPMTTLRFYDLDDETYTMAIGVGDEEVEMPSYFFRPGRYAAVNTAVEGGCESINLEECRAAGIIGMATFMIGPGDEIVPVTPSPDPTEEVVVTEETPPVEEVPTDAAPVDSISVGEIVPVVDDPPASETTPAETADLSPDAGASIEVPATEPSPEADPTVDITVTDGGTIDIVAH